MGVFVKIFIKINSFKSAKCRSPKCRIQRNIVRRNVIFGEMSLVEVSHSAKSRIRQNVARRNVAFGKMSLGEMLYSANCHSAKVQRRNVAYPFFIYIYTKNRVSDILVNHSKGVDFIVPLLMRIELFNCTCTSIK